MAFKMTNAPYKKGFFGKLLNSSSGKPGLKGEELRKFLVKTKNLPRK